MFVYKCVVGVRTIHVLTLITSDVQYDSIFLQKMDIFNSWEGMHAFSIQRSKGIHAFLQDKDIYTFELVNYSRI